VVLAHRGGRADHRVVIDVGVADKYPTALAVTAWVQILHTLTVGAGACDPLIWSGRAYWDRHVIQSLSWLKPFRCRGSRQLRRRRSLSGESPDWRTPRVPMPFCPKAEACGEPAQAHRSWCSTLRDLLRREGNVSRDKRDSTLEPVFGWVTRSPVLPW